jgi:D-beta-D-heptose 7-phosphate kinase/D-beta-D-heptose 1-phosphate adenosyltransferase
MMEMFAEIGADTSGIIKEKKRPTTRKTRIISANQHVLRIDRETRSDIRPKTFKRIRKYVEKQVPLMDVVLISDYGKGLVTRDLVSDVAETANRFGIPVIADPKGLDFSKYEGVNLLTPNQKEAGLAAGIEIHDDYGLSDAARRILEQVRIDRLLVTCGKDGMVLFDRENEPLTIKSTARQVFDVSGAGDTVLAAIGLALALDASLEDAMVLANTAAGIVVGKVGTATVTVGEIDTALGPVPDPAQIKRKTMRDLPAVVRETRKKGGRVVLTNGCFDLLHAGHVRLFAESRRFGDILIVAIDDDASVKKLKGAGRPVIKAIERIQLLSALDSVDYVVVFSSDRLERLIEIIRPDVLTKGANYSEDEVEGRDSVEQYGGRVELIPVSDALSASEIIRSIRKTNP